jgi:hypothetical protein
VEKHVVFIFTNMHGQLLQKLAIHVSKIDPFDRFQVQKFMYSDATTIDSLLPTNYVGTSVTIGASGQHWSLKLQLRSGVLAKSRAAAANLKVFVCNLRKPCRV